MSAIDFKPHPDALYFHIANDALTSAKAEKDELRLQQHVATAFVFSALCLEAFINQELARHSETSKILEEDDRMRLDLKWLLLPLLLGARGTFNKGTEPYQTFSQLLSLRNERLVHFKPHKETLTAVQRARKPKDYLCRSPKGRRPCGEIRIFHWQDDSGTPLSNWSEDQDAGVSYGLPLFTRSPGYEHCNDQL